MQQVCLVWRTGGTFDLFPIPSLNIFSLVVGKSLVFSQFSTTLQWLQEELPKHGFQYRTLKGDMSMQQRAKALHDFQSDPPTTVFLLSMRYVFVSKLFDLPSVFAIFCLIFPDVT